MDFKSIEASLWISFKAVLRVERTVVDLSGTLGEKRMVWNSLKVKRRAAMNRPQKIPVILVASGTSIDISSRNSINSIRLLIGIGKGEKYETGEKENKESKKRNKRGTKWDHSDPIGKRTQESHTPYERKNKIQRDQ